MSDTNLPEPWVRGTLTGVNPVIRAVLHALELAKEDLWKWCYPLNEERLNQAVATAAPVAFHLKHIARSLDRLLTYAEGSALNDKQLLALRTEHEAVMSREEVFAELSDAFEKSQERLRGLAGADFGTPRAVGKKQLPTTVGGLIVHIADHTQRHVGQAITTAKIVASR